MAVVERPPTTPDSTGGRSDRRLGRDRTAADAGRPRRRAAPTTAAEPEDDDSLFSALVTPILALARNRFVLPALALIALLSGVGALEITKRPRRGGLPEATAPAVARGVTMQGRTAGSPAGAVPRRRGARIAGPRVAALAVG